MTIPASNKEAAVEAAKAAGLDDYISVNPSSLKSWLVDRFKQNGSKGESLASGTPFDGVISEYHERKLSRQTQGE